MSVFCDTAGTIVRWAVSDGPLAVSLPDGVDGDVNVEAGEVGATARNDGQGLAWLDAGQVALLVPEVGCTTVNWSDSEQRPIGSTIVERVGNRYCTDDDVLAYGERNGDDFQRHPVWLRQQAIDAAEVAIEDSCGRSFCERARTVNMMGLMRLEELPVVDARSISDGVLVSDRQARVAEPGPHRVVFGAQTDSRIRSACTQLAAYLIRSRVTPENARGTSEDGVYISYTLATGDEGSWTGLPYVDAVIEEKRSMRVIVR